MSREYSSQAMYVLWIVCVYGLAIICWSFTEFNWLKHLDAAKLTWSYWLPKCRLNPSLTQVRLMRSALTGTCLDYTGNKTKSIGTWTFVLQTEKTACWRVHPLSSPPFCCCHFVVCHFVVSTLHHQSYCHKGTSWKGHFVVRHFVTETLHAHTMRTTNEDV